MKMGSAVLEILLRSTHGKTDGLNAVEIARLLFTKARNISKDIASLVKKGDIVECKIRKGDFIPRYKLP